MASRISSSRRAGDGVGLADPQPAAVAFEEEVNPGHARAAEKAKHRDPEILRGRGHGLVERRRREEFAGRVHVLVFIVVKLVTRHHLARDRCSRVPVSEHCDLDLASVEALLDQRALAVIEGTLNCWDEIRLFRDLADPD
jgi:hypothetical protein